MSKSYIEVEAFVSSEQEIYCKDCARRKGIKNGKERFVYEIGDVPCKACGIMDILDDVEAYSEAFPADVAPVPAGGIGEMSDGYHTFNGLYYQRMILFAALVKVYKDRAWKSYRHEDGELCFGGGWFIIGIDTPAGSYTYHYENKHFDLFECKELPAGKHWDGHTEKDVTRLLKLEPAAPQEMSAREYLTAEARMCKHYGLPCAFDASGLTVDKAIEMVKKFAREHPEERSEE